MLSYRSTPAIPLLSPILTKHNIRLVVKREDLNHPHVSGNKWWKLKNNLQFVLEQKIQTILTFGGAYSNHLYSTAAACNELGIKSIGVVRGEKITPLNPTLSFCADNNMHLAFVSRSEYDRKTESSFIENLHDQFGSFHIIPEGGSNDLGFSGCVELSKQINTLDFTHVVLAVGTGCTMAGLVAGLPDKEIVGVSVLKNGDFLRDEISSYLSGSYTSKHPKINLLTSYHHGGYAKVTPELQKFISDMENHHDLPLDPVYTGKALYALFQEVAKGNFDNGSAILFLHTGGLQGKFGFK
jgi:1-aminocyclopropane-1-carboxylate deaminase